ncbi:MAG: rod shape-determining protein MreC [Clostridia bacterium]|nr:rod shape-determining protein MreC [Clostridia bacterium]
MRFFFRSRKFKIISAVTAVILSLTLIAWIAGGIFAPQSSLSGVISSPFQRIATSISNGFRDFTQKFRDNETLIVEKSELQDEINHLNEQIADYEKIKAENEFYKNYLEIKDAHPDFQFESAVIISRDSNDEYGAFTIDAGSVDGIQVHDPVITDAGLVGYVSSVGLTTSKVTTILDPNISVGAIDSRTSDAGIIGGNLTLTSSGKTRMYNIRRTSSVAIGDYVVTSGSGVFPKGLLIGKISNISQEEFKTSLYAEIEPFVNVREIRQVMVITDFSGKTGGGK